MGRPRFGTRLAGLLVPVGVALVLGEFEGRSRLRALAQDALIAASLRQPPPLAPSIPDAALVLVDVASLRELDDWPWSRRRWARLVRWLSASGARTIAFDIDFSTPRDAEGDLDFGRAIAEADNVVLGTFPMFQPIEGVGTMETISEPVDVIGNSAKLSAALVELDADGHVRRQSLEYPVGQRRLPSLAAAALLRVGFSLPERPESSLLDFRRAAPPIPTVGVADIVQGRADPQTVRGRAVFVGADAPILQDLWPSPIHPATPGVLIHAIDYRALAGLSTGQRPLREATRLEQALLALFFSLGAGVAIRGDLSRRLLAALGLGSLALLASTFGATYGAWIADPFVPCTAILVHYGLSVETLRSRIAAKLRRRESWLGTVAQIGRLARSGTGSVAAEQALELLGSAVGVRSLQLLAVSSDGDVAEDGCGWGQRIEVNRELAGSALKHGEVIVVHCGDQGTSYLPLGSPQRPLGVLVVGHGCGDLEPSILARLEGTGSLLALATVNDALWRDLVSARDRAEAASRAKGLFLANMSHELRTPLAAILGYAQLLHDFELPDEERNRALIAIDASGAHLLHLIGEILDLSKIESGRFEAQSKPVALRTMLETLVGVLGQKAQNKGLALTWECTSATPDWVRCDERRLHQILYNLIGNAVKFTERGTVHVRCDGSANRIELDVEDSGPGVPESDIERIFQPFEQVDEELSTRRGGTGLGLAITRKLAEALGGGIEFESQLGAGTRVHVWLPCEPCPGGGETTASAVSLSGTVLVAEDGLDNQRIVSHFLRGAGLEVVLAPDGRQAVDRVTEQRGARAAFAAILMDIAMPILDGHEATREIRRLGYEGPIIALSAHATSDDREAALAAGCDAHLTKPIRREILLGVLRDFLGKSR